MSDDTLIRCCRVPETVLAEAAKRRSNRCAWWFDSNLSQLAHEVVEQSIQSRLDAWSAAADVGGTKASSRNTADLLITAVRIDGVGGVLADCELPGPLVQHMRYDLGEPWVIRPGTMPNGTIDLLRVTLHELGHFWGLPHYQGGIMAPYISATLDQLTNADIARIQVLYGPPVAPPPTPTQKTATFPQDIPAGTYLLTIKG